jgi:hypothetical protein
MWIGFILSVLIGAGLILSPQPGRQIVGFVLLFAPLVVFTLIMAAYYWRSRRMAEEAEE